METKEKIKEETKTWITTDPDNLQFRTEKGSTFKEFNRNKYPKIFEIYKGKTDRDLKPIWNIDKYWIEEHIDWKEHSLTDILTVVLVYENSLDDFIIKHKNDSESMLEEYIFEYYSGLY